MSVDQCNPINYAISKKDCILMILFLSLCGNNFVSTYLPSFLYVFLVFVLLFKIAVNKNYENIFDIQIKSGAKTICLTWIFLFILQYLFFDWNTFPGIVNHLSKFIVGVWFIALFGYRFCGVFFNAMYVVSFISLPFWLVQFFTHHGVPGFDWSLGKTIVLYSYREGFDIIRNCGFFWEPGAMGGYIVFAFLLFFNDLELLYKFNKKKCIVLFLTLLSTQSTGGYVNLGILIIVYILFSMKSRLKYALLPIVIIGGLYVYQGTDFLSKKIERQNEMAMEMKVGEFSSTRAGTVMFDLHYIQKHPLIGNGLHERTRLADHPYLVKMLKNHEVAAMGNGFTDQVAKWGVLYWIIFCFVFCKNNCFLEKKKKVCILLLFALLLQGEPFMNYPLFLAFPLIRVSCENFKCASLT
jgi:hypothetical protein